MRNIQLQCTGGQTGQRGGELVSLRRERSPKPKRERSHRRATDSPCMREQPINFLLFWVLISSRTVSFLVLPNPKRRRQEEKSFPGGRCRFLPFLSEGGSAAAGRIAADRQAYDLKARGCCRYWRTAFEIGTRRVSARKWVRAKRRRRRRSRACWKPGLFPLVGLENKRPGTALCGAGSVSCGRVWGARSRMSSRTLLGPVKLKYFTA